MRIRPASILPLLHTTPDAADSVPREHGEADVFMPMVGKNSEALQGQPEIRQADRIGLLRLLDYVTRRVADAASQIRHEQHPAVRGTFDGEFSWLVDGTGRPPGPFGIRTVEVTGETDDITPLLGGSSISHCTIVIDLGTDACATFSATSKPEDYAY